MERTFKEGNLGGNWDEDKWEGGNTFAGVVVLFGRSD